MSFYQKQYSSFHVLPKNENEIVTILPRKILKTDEFVNTFNPKNEIPLIGYLTNLLLNKKNDKMQQGECIQIKPSHLRNFLRRKIHAENKDVLDSILTSFFSKLNSVKTRFFHVFMCKDKLLNISLSSEYLKSLEKNTVSFNLLDLTKSRGLKSKLIFLRVIAFDMRDTKERFFTLISISKYLGLDCFNNRKNTIKMIKRALKGLSERQLITEDKYTGIDKKRAEKKL